MSHQVPHNPPNFDEQLPHTMPHVGLNNADPAPRDVSSETPAILSYTQGTGHPKGTDVLLRTSLVFAGFLVGLSAMVLPGLTIVWVEAIWGFEHVKIAGIVAMIVAVACSFLSLEQRRAGHWFLLGLLIGAGFISLAFGLIFLAV
jgi:hypothetical protein